MMNMNESQTAGRVTFAVINLFQIGCRIIIIIVVDNDGIIVMMIELTMSIMSIIVWFVVVLWMMKIVIVVIVVIGTTSKGISIVDCYEFITIFLFVRCIDIIIMIVIIIFRCGYNWTEIIFR